MTTMKAFIPFPHLTGWGGGGRGDGGKNRGERGGGGGEGGGRGKNGQKIGSLHRKGEDKEVYV